MTIISPSIRPALAPDSTNAKAYSQFVQLLSELRQRKLPEPLILSVNQHIEELNALPETDRKWRGKLRNKQSVIIRQVEKETKLVPRHYYRQLWMALGMAAFGLPLGAAFGLSIGNIGLMAIGLPIGMAIGVAIGSGMDKKAQQEGRQLDIELKY